MVWLVLGPPGTSPGTISVAHPLSRPFVMIIAPSSSVDPNTTARPHSAASVCGPPDRGQQGTGEVVEQTAVHRHRIALCRAEQLGNPRRPIRSSASRFLVSQVARGIGRRAHAGGPSGRFGTGCPASRWLVWTTASHGLPPANRRHQPVLTLSQSSLFLFSPCS